MIEISKQEARNIMNMWGQHEATIMKVFNSLVEEYASHLQRQDSEWETVRQSVEYTAKRQALIDFKNILSKKYDQTPS